MTASDEPSTILFKYHINFERTESQNQYISIIGIWNREWFGDSTLTPTIFLTIFVAFNDKYYIPIVI